MRAQVNETMKHPASWIQTTAENKWKEAEGKTFFVRGQDKGYSKVL